jgi:ATP-dependent Clp protease ATP-binding subunit ClpB
LSRGPGRRSVAAAALSSRYVTSRFLPDKAIDPVYGARPLERTIRRDVQNPLAIKILAGEYGEGDTALIGVDKTGELAFGKK